MNPNLAVQRILKRITCAAMLLQVVPHQPRWVCFAVSDNGTILRLESVEFVDILSEFWFERRVKPKVPLICCDDVIGKVHISMYWTAGIGPSAFGRPWGRALMGWNEPCYMGRGTGSIRVPKITLSRWDSAVRNARKQRFQLVRDNVGLPQQVFRARNVLIPSCATCATPDAHMHHRS